MQRFRVVVCTGISLCYVALLFSLKNISYNGQVKGSAQVITATIKISVCGNNVIEGGEDCEGLNLNGQSCRNLGYSKGTLRCEISCSFDTSGCIIIPTPTLLPTAVPTAIPISTLVPTLVPTLIPSHIPSATPIPTIPIKLIDVPTVIPSPTLKLISFLVVPTNIPEGGETEIPTKTNEIIKLLNGDIHEEGVNIENKQLINNTKQPFLQRMVIGVKNVISLELIPTIKLVYETVVKISVSVFKPIVIFFTRIVRF